MRATVSLVDGLLDQTRCEAERRGTTLTALIEGLRLVIHPPQPVDRGACIRLPLSRARTALVACVDLDDSSAVLDRVDGVV